MIIQSLPYPAETAIASPEGALIYYTSFLVGGTVAFNQEVYDDGGWFNAASSRTNIVVPSGVTLARMIGQYVTTGAATPEVGHGVNGGARPGVGVTNTQENWASCVTSPLVLAAGNTGQLFGSGGTQDLTGGIWNAVEKLDPATKYCLLAKSANQALVANTNTPITWQTEVVDNGGWFDSASSTTKAIVPAGVTRIRVCFGVVSTAFVNTNYTIWVRKNNANVAGGAAISSTFTGKMNSASAILEVAPGDEIELMARTGSAQTIAAEARVWFSVEEVPDYARVLVKKVATQNHVANTTSIIAFGAGSTVYDGYNCHDETTNNSRLSVPPGPWTRARLVYGLVSGNTGNPSKAWVRKNGAGTYPILGLPGFDNTNAGAEFLSGIGAWIPVTPGTDYFELCHFSSGAHTLPVEDRTYFGMELAA